MTIVFALMVVFVTLLVTITITNLYDLTIYYTDKITI